MDKVFNWISLTFGVIGGFIVQRLGGGDVLLKTVVAFVVLDYLTGLVKAFYTKQLSSEIGFKGICKKVMLFLVIAFSVFVEGIMPMDTPIREVTIMFFIANEGISLLENAAEVIPIPQKLKDVLLQLRDKSTKDGE